MPQTLRVRSSEAETIVFPSGEKATERMKSLCALVFSLVSSSVTACGGRSCQFCAKRQLSNASTCIPDFEGAVKGTRNDRLSVWRKGHGEDCTAVRVRLLALELQCDCARWQELSVLRKAAIE